MSQSGKARLLIAGDYHVYGRYDSYLRSNPGHRVFDQELCGFIRGYPVSIFNLEDPITDARKGCVKWGPYGVGSELALEQIEELGFSLATFATNHTYDMRNQGIRDSIDLCANHGIKVFGAGLDPESAARPMRIEADGIKISILNFSRCEFNCSNISHGGANSLDLIDNCRDIIKEKQSSDFVLVIVHDGVDTYSLPYPLLRKQMRFFADMGADAIVLHHSQRVSGYEVYLGKPIIYGIGNLLHWTDNVADHEGLLVELVFTKGRTVDFKLHAIGFDSKTVKVKLASESSYRAIMERVHSLSDIIKDDVLLKSQWENHLDSKSASYISAVAFKPPVFAALARKMGLQQFYLRFLLLGKRRLLRALNLFRCEAHRQAILNILSRAFGESER